MRLPTFIEMNTDPIVAEWVNFARSIWPRESADIDPQELRDHAVDLLQAIVADMRSAQSPHEQSEKSQGRDADSPTGTHLNDVSTYHAFSRVESGFELMTVVAEFRALRASVMRLWHESASTPDLNDIADITRFNEAVDQSLQRSVRSFTERVARSRQLFLATLGHDLRNPLNAVVLGSQFLERATQGNALVSDTAHSIFSSASMMNRLISDLLDFTAAGLGGTMPIKCRSMDLHALVNDVVDEYRRSHPAYVFRIELSGEPMISADSDRLRQVFSNLLGNAVQHGDAACGVDLRVADETPTTLSLRVTNGGNPIAEADLGRVFEPMVQSVSDDGKPRRRGSMGLGLFISRAVVISHGGAIDVTSNAADGTTFTVHLPRTERKPLTPRY